MSNLPPRQYADTVFTNGKIVSMDDSEINTNPGTIAEAMAVRGGEIIELGSASDVDRWVGSETKIIELEERTVIPGIIDCHSHLHEKSARIFSPMIAPELHDKHFKWVRGEYDSPGAIRDAIIEEINRSTDELDAGEFLCVMPYRARFYSDLTDAFKDHTSHDLTRVEEPQWDEDLIGLAWEMMEQDPITKDELDDIAPNHPVLVGVHPTYVPNSLGYQWYEEKYGILDLEGVQTLDLYRAILFDVILGGDPELIAETIQIGQEVYLANGITTIGTHVYPMSALDGYAHHDRNDSMDMRVAWGDRTWQFLNPEGDRYHKRISQLHGTGSDYLWNGGVSLGAMDKAPPYIATSLEAPKEVKEKEDHRWVQDGHPHYEALKNIAERGARFACSNHVLGDHAVDRSIEAIIEGSKRGGLSDEEIAERQHGLDHGGLYPRPDQIEICKKYNIRLNLNLYEGWRIKHHSGMIKAYPESEQEKAETWYAAAKTALDNDLKVGIHCRELENPFAHIGAFVTRKWKGKVIGADQAIHRVKALKAATIWNAGYLLREEDLGSLEPGKRADFVVLDRDYLEIPKSEIKDISPTMTVVDGEIKHTQPGYH